MLAEHTNDTIALREAFAEFNEQSLQLADSYRVLQDKVAALNQELAQLRSARHQELLEKERLGNRLARLLDALPGAIVVLDGGGYIRECNANSIKLLNRPLAGRAWSEIVRREFCPGKNSDGELQHRDGRWLSLSRRSLRAEPGEILLLTDVTETRSMRDMLQRHQRLSQLGEMTARLAHQIRTPLTSALLYSSQLSKLSEPESINAQFAASTVARLRDLENMVNDMLVFASGARPTDDTIPLADLFADVVDSMTPQLSSSARLSILLTDSGLSVEGNREALLGALLNLVSNSLQACGADARIELGALMPNDREICLTVSDNGPGIAAELREQIFEPFFTTRPQGTGLGLAVVRSVAEAHRGSVLVDSGRGGSTFALCLPVVAQAPALASGKRVDLAANTVAVTKLPEPAHA